MQSKTKTGMKLNLSKFESLVLRLIELIWLTIGDINLTTGMVLIIKIKHTIGREGKLKQKPLDLLKIFIKKKKQNA